MLPECLMNVCQSKSSMEDYKLENAPMVVRRDTRTPSTPPLRLQHTNRVVGTDYTGSNKWRGLIRRGASEYEAKRISEAEQKRA